MKVHLSLETLDGERIAEIETDQVFRDVFGDLTMGGALKVLGLCLETQVLSPARGLIRAYIAGLEEKLPHRRRDDGGRPPAWPGDQEILEEMDRRAVAMMK